MTRTRGYRVGKRHTTVACEGVPSGRHRWDEVGHCARCGRDYYEVTESIKPTVERRRAYEARRYARPDLKQLRINARIERLELKLAGLREKPQ